MLGYEPSPYAFESVDTDAASGCVMLRVSALHTRVALFGVDGLVAELGDPVDFHIPEDERYEGDSSQWWITGKVPEEDLHVTVKYGLHESVTTEQVKDVLADWKYEPELSVSRFEVFNNVEHDVIVARVMSPGLQEGHARLSCLPHIDYYSQYRAHVTLGYVNPGSGNRIIRDFVDGFGSHGAGFGFRTKDLTGMGL